MKPKAEPPPPTKERVVKCVVWDLDNTLWDGTLLEDEQVVLRRNVADVIKTLDARGIVHSIASRNDYRAAMSKLAEFGLEEYFLHPQINWNSKAASIRAIARDINIGLDAVAFVDDQPFELEEVAHSLPEVLCFEAARVDEFPHLPSVNPRFVTEDAKLRRLMYLSEARRKQAEEEFVGPKEEFLATLGMSFTISRATEEDLKRAEELTARTNQLNTTGYTYSYDELDHFRQSPRHRLLIASLSDKYGDYGKIGLALVETTADGWVIKLLLMSCRVMSRSVGTVMLNHIMARAKEHGARLRAEFVSNDRNRMMYVTYKFAGFKEVGRDGALTILESDLARIQPFPGYVRVSVED